jgi:protein-S-isoprenylcysteine O-methyltransferase Ste14
MPDDPATATAIHRRKPRLLPPIYFLLFNGLLILLDKLLPIATLLDPPWQMIGWLPVLIGTGLAVAGVMQFRRHQTSLKPFDQSTALVTTGIYRLTRNPMYLGMVIAMAGVALIAGSLSVWLIPPAFAATLHYRFIRVEEQVIAQQFGEDYERYRREVRRWV